ncbi:hypothetical protein PV326_000633, partial [Microctonus aethiopoides]
TPNRRRRGPGLNFVHNENHEFLTSTQPESKFMSYFKPYDWHSLPPMQPSDCIKVCIQDVGVRGPAEVLRLSLSKHKIRQSCARNGWADEDNRMSIRLFGVIQKDKNFDSGIYLQLHGT